MITHLLYETPSGYALFQRGEMDEIAQEWHQVQSSLANLAQFSKALKLIAFYPFQSATDALENMNDITEGIMHHSLRSFLELNLQKDKNVVLGVLEKSLAGSIKAGLKIECESNEVVHELGRAVRFHASKVLKPLNEGDLDKACLGLGHAYSQTKLQYDVHKSDHMVIQAVNTLDQLDKDVNTFSMRVREWYSWHFPELAKLVSDPAMYPQLVKRIGDREKMSDSVEEEIAVLIGEEKAKEVVEAAKRSMGTAISQVDLIQLMLFANRVLGLLQFRASLLQYLQSKMHLVAPNLSTLIGVVLAARLISHAGSLTSLSKYPASTVQILGAEKALFRALKTKSNTPKFGLLYHSGFIGKAHSKNKGRISRLLANKCSMASRVDAFSETASTSFGESLKNHMEARLEFYDKLHKQHVSQS